MKENKCIVNALPQVMIFFYVQGIENSIPIQLRAKWNFHRRTDVDRET